MFDLLKRNKESASLPVELQEVDELHLLSEQIYFCRQELDLTQDELAEVAGMTQAQIANLEAGRSNPTVRTLVKVANALNCRLNRLFSPVGAEKYTYAPASVWTSAADGRVPFDELVLWLDAKKPGAEECEPMVGPKRKDQTDWLQNPHRVEIAIWNIGSEACLLPEAVGERG